MKNLVKIRLFFSTLLVFLMVSCNIFSPFHDEGKSVDPETLLADAIAALNRDDPQAAFNILEKAKRLAPDNPNILYYHAVARMQIDSLDFYDFVDVFTQHKSAGGGTALQKVVGTQQDSITLFSADNDILPIWMDALWVVETDFDNILQGLERGKTVENGLPFLDDVYLSCGMAKILNGLLLILDDDHQGPEFTASRMCSIIKVNTQYVVSCDDGAIELPENHVRALRERFRQGLNCLWQYYFMSIAVAAQPPFPLPPAALPASLTTDNTPAGVFLKVSFLGIAALFDQVLILNQ